MQKPTSVVVFGILCIVFGAMVLCTLPCTLGAQLMPVSGNAPQMGNVMMSTPLLRGYSMASLLIGVPMAIWQLAAGIGLVRSRPWGRSLAVGYGYAAILVALASTAAAIALIVPAAQQAAQGIQDPMAKRIMSLMPVFIVFGTCFSLVYPVLLLVFMSRQNVKAYFAAVAAADEAGQPLHPPEAQAAGQTWQQHPPPPGAQPPPWTPPPGSPPPPPSSEQ